MIDAFLTSSMRWGRRRAATGALCAALVAVAGCSGGGRGPYGEGPEMDRRPRESEGLALRGAELLERGDADSVAAAERLLREALDLDLYNGPAHNNLGVVLLGRGDLYGAAREFEWAGRLMPGHPDPKVNLALALERAGRTEEALERYAAALEAYPGHVPAMQGLVLLQVRSGRADERTRERLAEIALRGESEEWRRWARDRMARLER